MMLGSLAMFALGSALCGAAQNINWLIAARSTSLPSTLVPLYNAQSHIAIQGAGGGGLLSLTSIILSDMVTLKERAMYNALIGL